MIEQKLVVGRYIELNTPHPAPSGAAAPPGFLPLTSVVLHINESQHVSAPVQQNVTMPGFNPTTTQQIKIAAQQSMAQLKSKFDIQRTSTTAPGTVAKAHRNFVWQEWVPGKVSETQPGTTDVLTGPMSGCWITLYTRNGARSVGHIGTEDDPNTQNSRDAKNSWNAFAAGVAPGTIKGFNPRRDWVGAFPPAQPGEAGMKIFAVVTGADTFHTVVTYPQLAKVTRIRIAAIQKMNSTLPANAQV
jgi:hypothetical protein